VTLSVNQDRLWQAHLDMAAVGATPEGGSNRPALSAADAEARALLLSWCEPLKLKLERDGIGNLFLRRGGRAERPAVAFGSHLDTVPTGGRFDGAFGVLAGLEALRTLHDAEVLTAAPLELVVWTNEEGSRFPPAMMGSRVHAGALPLDRALTTTDDGGETVGEALAETFQIGFSTPGPRDWAAWIEPHIEQGPVLEQAGAAIGVVTGTVQALYFQLTITGEASHAGATAMGGRRDSLAAAAEMILATEQIGLSGEPGGRSSAAWIGNAPNARGAVPSQTRLHCDVRHEDPARAAAMEAAARIAWTAIAARRGVQLEVDAYASFGPAQFDPGLGALLREVAAARQLPVRDMVAAAGHDSVLIAPLCPSAMLFVPSRGGVTHHPTEYTAPQHLAQGAQVLLDAVMRLAN
jgi:N-carbamoyl-L-amino-acid hydrolase